MSIQGPFEQERASSGADLPDDTHALALEEYQALLRAAEQLLDDVERALASLDAGDYGTCDACGALIEDRDLEEDPLVTRCAAHRSVQVEEQVDGQVEEQVET